MKYIKITGFLTLLFFLLPPSASALEITVEGNGESSSQEVSVQNEQTTQVSQNNAASVQNNVDINASSGGNSASGNAGENTNISTGAVQASEAITNALNSASASHACCDGQGTTITVSDNGANSTNTVEAHTSVSTQINVSQTAGINNTTRISANSGGNQANNNGGNVSISSGNVVVENKITNKNINGAEVYIGQGGINISIIVSGNGAESTNKISFSQNAINWVEIQSILLLNNITLIDANSGRNEANGNLGDVTISTGNVNIKTEVENKDINTSKTVIDCCKDNGHDDNDGDDDDDNPPPVTPPSGGNGGGGSSSNGGGSSSQVLGITVGQILPASGTPWFIYMTLANIFTFLLGLYLRLRGGRSPSPMPIYA